MAVEVILPQVLPKVVCVIEALVTELTQWVTFVGLVIFISHTAMEGQVFTAVEFAFIRENLWEISYSSSLNKTTKLVRISDAR